MSDPFDDFCKFIEEQASEIEKKYKKIEQSHQKNIARKNISNHEFSLKSLSTADSLRQLHKINIIKHIEAVSSGDVSVIEYFTDLRLDKSVYNRLRHFNMLKATPIQMQIIPLFLREYNIFGQSQTGTGKTLCFVLPLVLLKKIERMKGALVLLPTRELCMQVEAFFNHFISVIGIYGGSVNYLKKDTSNEIIVATPGRLLQILDKRNYISDFSHFVLDEFDKMTSKEFIKNISKIHSMMISPQVCVLSATFPRNKLDPKQFNFDFEVFIDDRDKICQNITQKIYTCDDKFQLLISIIERNAVIFTNTKDQADQLVVDLQNFFKKQDSKVGLIVDSLHGGRYQTDRNEILTSFHNNKIDMLVCTGLMSRGIDFKTDVIINYELPLTIDDYIHQIGRTGRIRYGAVYNGIAHTLISTDQIIYEQFSKFLKENDLQIEEDVC